MEMIPLSALRPSEANARKTDKEADIESLVASIKAHGLLHNLVVRKKGKQYEVVDGERRRQALEAIWKDERDKPMVACTVLEDADDTEVSLAANVERAALHPLDEYEAFADLARRHMPVAEIAVRFGVDETRVNQRLALGTLSPKIRDKIRKGKCSWETARALTLTSDQKEQERLFKQYGDSPWRIRSSLRATKILVKHALFPVEAYTDAGGQVLTDLFAEVDRDGTPPVFADSKLFWKLQDAEIEKLDNKLREDGWGRVEIVPEWSGWSLPKGWGNASLGSKPSKTKMAGATAVIVRREDGKVELAGGFLNPEQAKAAKKAERAKAEHQAAAAGEELAPEPTKEKATLTKAGLAQVNIAKELAVQVEILRDHRLALILACMGLTCHGVYDLHLRGQDSNAPALLEQEFVNNADAKALSEPFNLLLRRDAGEAAAGDAKAAMLRRFGPARFFYERLNALTDAELKATFNALIAHQVWMQIRDCEIDPAGTIALVGAVKSIDMRSRWVMTPVFLRQCKKARLFGIAEDIGLTACGAVWPELLVTGKEKVDLLVHKIGKAVERAFAWQEGEPGEELVRAIRTYLPAEMTFPAPMEPDAMNNEVDSIAGSGDDDEADPAATAAE